MAGNAAWALELELSGHTADVHGCGWSPNGTCLAIASNDRTVRVWHVNTGEVAKLEGHGDHVWSCSWCPDGARLASASSDKTVRVWNVDTEREVAKLEGHTDIVFSCAWSPDGARLASASHDETVRVWDVNTWLEVYKLVHLCGVSWCAWRPDARDGVQLASAGDNGMIRVWENLETNTDDGLADLEHGGQLYTCAWSPDGAYIAAASADGTVRVVEVNTGLMVAELEGHAGNVYTCGALMAPSSPPRRNTRRCACGMPAPGARWLSWRATATKLSRARGAPTARE
jgi:WD40 repeat protein